MLSQSYRDDAVKRFQELKALADKSVERVGDAEYFGTLDPESNSMAVIVKHLAGNLRSRWTDFLTTDGEKPDRRRDAEFVIGAEDSRPALQAAWERGWRCLFDTLDGLGPESLEGTVTIRGQPMPVVEAINRALIHYGYHVGQLVLLAKHHRSAAWESLSIPRRIPPDMGPAAGRPGDRRA